MMLRWCKKCADITNHEKDTLVGWYCLKCMLKKCREETELELVKWILIRYKIQTFMLEVENTSAFSLRKANIYIEPILNHIHDNNSTSYKRNIAST